MNREILFKAKRIDNGEWVEGYYYDPNFTDEKLIIDKMFNVFEIDTNTICQYTGLTDKNGNKIWENDIVAFTDDFASIKWDNKRTRFIILFRDDEQFDFDNTWNESVKVVGNNFDNPELFGAWAYKNNSSIPTPQTLQETLSRSKERTAFDTMAMYEVAELVDDITEIVKDGIPDSK